MRLYLSVVFFLMFSEASSARLSSARNLGFAGVGSVNAEATALLLNTNPAALSLNADLEFGGGYNSGELSSGADQKGYHLWAKDSTASSFYTERNQAVLNSLTEVRNAIPLTAVVSFVDQDVAGLDFKTYQLALSKVLMKRLSFGTSFRYIDGSLSGQPLEKWSGDLGLVYKLFRSVDLGLSWLNFNSNELEIERLRFGASYTLQDLARFFFDFEKGMDDVADGLSYGLGFEAKIRQFFAFRTGYFASDVDDLDYVGLGLSFMGPRLQVHYGVRVETDSRAALHSVDFSLPLW